MGCGFEVGFRNESKPFNTKYTINKVNRACFFHYKGAECSFKKEVGSNDSDDSDGSETRGCGSDVLDKRKKLLNFLIRKTYNSYKSYKEYQDILFQHIKEARKYHIDYESLMNDYVKNIYEKKVVNIGFKEIEYLDIDMGVLYIINDYCLISEYCKKKICEDDDLFLNYLKKISKISIYYSKCNANKNIEQEVKEYKSKLILARFIDDD